VQTLALLLHPTSCCHSTYSTDREQQFAGLLTFGCPSVSTPAPQMMGGGGMPGMGGMGGMPGGMDMASLAQVGDLLDCTNFGCVCCSALCCGEAPPALATPAAAAAAADVTHTCNPYC
jgi:hypothetical protein